MEDKMIKTKRKKNPNKLFPFLLLGGLFVILVVMVLSISAKEKISGNLGEEQPDGTQNESEDRQVMFTGVLKETDETAVSMTFRDINDGQDYILNYTRGTNFVDKYGKISIISSINPGEIVDATYNKDTGKLITVQISSKAFEYKGISNWSLDTGIKSLTIAGSKYKYGDNVVVSSKGEIITIEDLDPIDELTVKGNDREIYSVIVTKGHGSLRFANYEDFLGGIAYIGTRYTLPVTDDMIVTVREGEYSVTLEIDDFTGTKQVIAVQGEEVLVDMSEFKKPVVSTGKVKFAITPAGADLFIDGLATEYDDEVTLEYGEYSIKVSLGGYTTYTGTIGLEEEEKLVTIDLAQSSTGTDEEEEEDADGDGTTEGTNGSGETDNSTDYEEVDSKNYIYVEAPEGASVYFNGQFKGTAPVSFPKETGTQYVTLIKSGYTTKTYTIEVSDDSKDVKLSFPDMVIQN